ncbi:hypothetical protein FT663_01783 [Candidozyma haemuli var. vulneris]|uniref:Core domain-containing protein n=1 Tax=Candidozyma haemuli TaxID=45357 RepID=A0A2V1AYI1_9ASCO|nr:hypothetical protein CXQ85_002878 [[Candida] haemuloni]KAF3991094.1 hypothetical protein FT662_01922 [[Candida] haemuloni var. vulneris]KAF3993615.1 hypothetical protein FT663_01783 [[Candida] haemuloni var. vulneris]PVH23150.1 hypothetical protein CXQ85_002878 [[Candida] haemuloni]
MLSRFLRTSTLPSARQIVRLPLRSSSALFRPVRFYSAEPAKSLKSSTFSLPKDVPPELEDFKLTKLVTGKTNLRIAITDRAKDKLTQIAKDDNNPDSALRIKVESGGCHGFQYNLELTNLSKELESESDLLVFERDDAKSAKVIFDESSLEILQDSRIDFTTELIGTSFKVTDSPYTSTSCGCGASFDFDFDKLHAAKGE